LKYSENILSANESYFETALESSSLGIGDVHVTRSNATISGVLSWQYTVTFVALDGDIDLLSINSSSLTSGSASVAEFLKGQANEFIIEPKKASGAVVQDLDSASGFKGKDLFYTELWNSDASGPGQLPNWYQDGDLATYNSVEYCIQKIAIASGTTGNFTLTYDTSSRLNGTYATTSSLSTMYVTAYGLKLALEELSNIESVDVTSSGTYSSGLTFSVTFTGNFGALPTLGIHGVTGSVSVIQTGVTEIQTIVTRADTDFVPEVQTILTSGTITGGTFKINFYGHTEKSSSIAYDAVATSVKSALESMSFVGSVKVTRTTISSSSGTYMWAITFLDPVGDVPTMVITSSLTGTSPTVTVAEVTKGTSSLGGTFVLSYMGQYTNNLAFDASAQSVKDELEALSTVTEVEVYKEDLYNGHKWTVTFTKQLGNLPAIVAYPFQYEIQTISTTGGSPTPLGGSFYLTYMNESTNVLSFDVSAAGLEAALESLSSIGNVDVNRVVSTNGQYTWSVTFRSDIGNVDMIVPTYSGLTGSNAKVTVVETVSGSSASLTGENPSVIVEEKVAGLPSYTANYYASSIGSYLLAVRQLTPGGLTGSYFDNQWLSGSPVIQRIDPEINFNWANGLITTYGSDYVSIRWVGKLLADVDEEFTLYLTADDGARVYINHTLVLDQWDSVAVFYVLMSTFLQLDILILSLNIRKLLD